MTLDATKKLDAMKDAITALAQLEPEDRPSALYWIAQELGVTGSLQSVGASLGSVGANVIDSGGGVIVDASAMTAKQFMSAKRPTTDVERIACLAYYLTHVKNTAEFKTLDLTTLNTEAAGRKFGNASQAANNALNQNGFLAPAGKGKRQITTRAEAVVEALPDREKVTAALAEHPKGGRRRGTTAKRKRKTGTKKTATKK
jgi:hypothetical protein